MCAQLYNERWEAAIVRLASRRHGVFSIDEVVVLGATRREIGYRLKTGRWLSLHRGVYAINGQPVTWRQSVMAAILSVGEGAVASHATAAALWSLPGFGEGPVEITTPHPGRHRRPFTVHRALTLPSSDVTTIDAIPITRTARTLRDLAGTHPEEAVEIALDDALRRRLVTIPALRRTLEQIPRKAGLNTLRRLLDERDDGARPAESPLETKLLRLLKTHGLPKPVRQYPVQVGGRRFRIDFAYPQAMVAIEADGYRHHHGRRAWQNDRERRNLLTQAGWRIVHVTWEDVTERPAETAIRIRRFLTAPILAR